MKYFPRQWEETDICLWNKDVCSSLLTAVLSYPRSIGRTIFILNQFLEDLVIHYQHLCISDYHPCWTMIPSYRICHQPIFLPVNMRSWEMMDLCMFQGFKCWSSSCSWPCWGCNPWSIITYDITVFKSRPQNKR